MYNNQDWINKLTGKQGQHEQQYALEALNKHLYKVAYSQLCKVSSSKAALEALGSNDIADIAVDFSQDAIEKIVQNNFALLEKYSQTGSFLAWASKITSRIISSELRRPYWARRNQISEKQYNDQPEEVYLPETIALAEEVTQAMEECIQQLPERRRMIFVRGIVEQESAEDIAQELESTSNAIHVLNHRTREKLRRCMQKKGFDKDTLTLF